MAHHLPIERKRKGIKFHAFYRYTILFHHVGQLDQLPQVLHRVFMGSTTKQVVIQHLLEPVLEVKYYSFKQLGELDGIDFP